MKKEYRNAVRSRKMIKTAFIELMSEKDADKITIVDVVEKADLSRNTFYAHYQDIVAVKEEIENDFINKLNGYLDEAVEKKEINNPLPLILRISHFIDKDKELNAILISSTRANSLMDKLRTIVVDRVIENMDTLPIKDKTGFLVFVEYSANGALGLFKKYLNDEIDMPIDDISKEISKIFLSGVPLYK